MIYGFNSSASTLRPMTGFVPTNFFIQMPSIYCIYIYLKNHEQDTVNTRYIENLNNERYIFFIISMPFHEFLPFFFRPNNLTTSCAHSCGVNGNVKCWG